MLAMRSQHTRLAPTWSLPSERPWSGCAAPTAYPSSLRGLPPPTRPLQAPSTRLVAPAGPLRPLRGTPCTPVLLC